MPYIIIIYNIAIAIFITGCVNIIVYILIILAYIKRNSQSISSGVIGFYSISNLLRLQKELTLLFNI